MIRGGGKTDPVKPTTGSKAKQSLGEKKKRIFWCCPVGRPPTIPDHFTCRARRALPGYLRRTETLSPRKN